MTTNQITNTTASFFIDETIGLSKFKFNLSKLKSQPETASLFVGSKGVKTTRVNLIGRFLCSQIESLST